MAKSIFMLLLMLIGIKLIGVYESALVAQEVTRTVQGNYLKYIRITDPIRLFRATLTSSTIFVKGGRVDELMEEGIYSTMPPIRAP